MRVAIHAVGRMKSGPEAELLEHFLRRARASGRAVGITAIEVFDLPESRLPEAPARRRGEAAALLAQAGTVGTFVALDETGTNLSSEAFAAHLRKLLDSGETRLSFLIGGPDGHALQALEAASLRLAFGKATWPHRLVRVLLAEQLYRAVTILTGHPYHRA